MGIAAECIRALLQPDQELIGEEERGEAGALLIADTLQMIQAAIRGLSSGNGQ